MGPKITILMKCGFICDIGVAVRGARKKQESCACNCSSLDTQNKEKSGFQMVPESLLTI